jgi:hypothetical protein
VQAIHDHARWTRGYGLGLNLIREGERLLAGHGGAMPGFIAGMYVSPQDRIGAVVLTNSSTANVEELTVRLAVKTIEAMPTAPEPWKPDAPVPDDVAPLLGSWWSEGYELVFRWRAGKLEIRGATDAPTDPPAVLEQLDADRWRTVSGPEHGELLRLTRDENGAIVKLNWAGYPVSREQRLFTAE